MIRTKDAKEDLKAIIRAHLDKAASPLFVDKSIEIMDESAYSKESFTVTAQRICKRIEMFISKELAQTVYKNLTDKIGVIDTPQGTRRRHRRVPFTEIVRVRCKGESYELKADNLSESGIFILMNDPFRLGTEVEITIPLTKEKSVPLKGVVVYRKEPDTEASRRPSGIGVEFKELGAREREMLQSYIVMV